MIPTNLATPPPPDPNAIGAAYSSPSGRLPQFGRGYWEVQGICPPFSTVINTKFGSDFQVVQRAQFMTALLDLAPALDSSAGPDISVAQPIFGPDPVLTIRITGLRGVAVGLEMAVFTMEFGAVVNPRTVVQIGGRHDASPDVWDMLDEFAPAVVPATSNSTLFTFNPPLGLRYWQAALVFDIYSQGASAPLVTIDASCSGAGATVPIVYSPPGGVAQGVPPRGTVPGTFPLPPRRGPGG